MIDLSSTQQTPLHVCRVCASPNDSASGPDEANLDGALSICLSCSTIGIYRADGTIREPTMDEINEIVRDPNVVHHIAATHIFQRTKSD